MQEAARELTVFVLQVPATLLHLPQAALKLIFLTVRAANKFEAFLRTLLWIHHSPAQAGTAGSGQHKNFGTGKNSLRKICTHQENGSANSCSTEPYGKHSSRVITRLWKEFLLEEGTAHGALDTRGCQLRKHRDELWQSLATSPTLLPPSCQ